MQQTLVNSKTSELETLVGISSSSNYMEVDINYVTPKNDTDYYHFPLSNICFVCVKETSPPQGDTLIVSAYVGSDPASTVHPKKYQEYQAPQKNI